MDETYIGGAEPGLARWARPGQEGSDWHRRRGPGRPGGWVGVGSRRWPMGPASLCTNSCWTTWSRAPRSSLTGGRPIRGWRNSAMCMIGAARAQLALGATIPSSAPARRASGRLAGQAVAPGHPPGLRRRRPSGQLSRRVRVPLQPPPFPQPWHGILPRARAGRRPQTDALSGSHRQPTTKKGATRTARTARPSHES